MTQTLPVEDETVAGGVSGRAGSYYRPHLDGLRAIAVYLVVLFHAGYARFSGGYVGVDVFFVLSGYLVTQVLLRDLAARDSIGFSRFYARRYRRLLPAAFVALLVTAAAYAALASPADALSAVNAFKASFLYVANWFFIRRSTAYFGGDITQNPVLHFWSLAVEEQFYLAWPLVLAGLYAITRRLNRRTRALQAIVATAAVISLAWAFHLRTANPTHAYYGTDTRAYQLLAGALIALTPGLITRAASIGRAARALPTAGLIVLLFLATSWVHLDAIERGALVMVTTVVFIIALEAAHRDHVKRFLSTGPVVYLGRISYGTYLWHWPVILVMTELLHLSVLTTVALTALIATSLASLSHQLLERPVRESKLLDRWRAPVIAIGLAISIVSALVFVPGLLQPSSSSANTVHGNTTTGLTPVPAGLDWSRAVFSALPPTPDCYRKDPSACIVVHGTGRHVLLLGDSHARMLLPTFIDIARKENLTLSVVSSGGCPWQRQVYTGVNNAGCHLRKEDAYTRVIPALHPDVIVAVNFGYDSQVYPPFPVEGQGGHRQFIRGTAAFDTFMLRTTNASVRNLLHDSHDLVLVEPIPRGGSFDPTACLRKSKFLEPCRFVADTATTPLVAHYRRLAAISNRIWSADFDKLACPFYPICDPVVAGLIVRIDEDHLTLDYARYIAPQVDEYLRANKLIGSS